MRYGDPAEAKKIVQDLLDGIDQAYTSGDFDLHCQLVHVPHHIRTQTEAFAIRNVDEMRTAFNIFREHTLGFGGVKCKRTCQSAKFKGRDKIESVHTVEYFDENGTHVMPVTDTTVMTMHVGLGWRICASTNTTKISTGASDALRGTARHKREGKKELTS